MEVLKNRPAGFWIGFAASCIMFAADIGYVISDRGDRTFSWIAFGLILAGVFAQTANAFRDLRIIPLLCAVCFGTALSFHLYVGLPTLSDRMNGVNFIGGNPVAVVTFGGIFLLGSLAASVSCFMEQRKEILFRLES